MFARLDFAYPGQRVAIEVDGARHHSGRAAWERDLRRRSRLTAMGWRIIHVTAADLRERAESKAGKIREALGIVSLL